MKTFTIVTGEPRNKVKFTPNILSTESIIILKDLIKNDLKANRNVWQYERRRELYKLAYEFGLNDFVNEQKLIFKD